MRDPVGAALMPLGSGPQDPCTPRSALPLHNPSLAVGFIYWAVTNPGIAPSQEVQSKRGSTQVLVSIDPG